MAPGKRYFEEADADGDAAMLASTSTDLAGLDAAEGSASASDRGNSSDSDVVAIQEAKGRRPFVSKRLRPVRDPSKPQTTLFVSSLPYTATKTDLETFFSDIGPLRRAFVVEDRETHKSKGVGYVSFAVHEDAQRAINELQGRSLDGGKRKMRIEWATRGAGEGQEQAAGPSKVAGTSKAAAGDKDPDAVRTIVMAGLASCSPAADSKSIYKRTRKIGDVDSVVYPAAVTALAQEPSNDVAHVVYRTPNHAMTAVTKLHGHTFKGAQLSVVLKKRADGEARREAHMRPETKAKRDEVRRRIQEQQEEQLRASKAEAAKAANANGSAARSLPAGDVNRGSRLIVRNLPFDVTDRDLRAVFLPFGPIYSIDVPQKPTAAEKRRQAKAAADDGSDSDADEAGDMSATAPVPEPQKQGRGRGFAFVWLVSRADASNAIKGVNGAELQHGAFEKAQLKAAKGKAGREAAKAALEEVLANAQPARQIAVDWALSKRDYELRKDESEAEDTGAEDSGAESSEEESDDDSDESNDSDDSDLDPIAMEDAEEESSATSGEEADDEPAKPALPTPDEGTTLFIRNLPYQATEQELRDLFRTFGPLRYAKVTIDKATKRPKGTAFVCFWQKDSADKALQQARLVETESGTSAHGGAKKNPFSAASVLTADPSAPLTMNLNLHGRVLSVVPALARKEADSIADASASAREKRDKRNTHLIREGVPLPGTPLESQLNEREIERRLANFQVRKSQMTKNPSLFMSKTRLSVRQLPLFVSDKLLKRLAAHAVKTFDEEVESGAREGLTEEELRSSRELAVTAAKEDDKTTEAAGDVGDGSQSKKQLLRQKRKEALQRRRVSNKGGMSVVQSKVVLQKDRLDAVTGVGRSRGYGFLEMATFADALKVVRWANANVSLRKLLIKWYAEELTALSKKLQAQEPTSADKSRADTSDNSAARLKRVQQKIKQLKQGRVDPDEEGTRGGLLIVEFSVENIVVVKKRAERDDVIAKRKKRKEAREAAEADTSSTSTGTGKRSRGDDAANEGRRKKARPSTWNQKTTKGVKGRSKATGAASAGGANALPLGTKRIEGGVDGGHSADAKQGKQGTVVGSLIGRKRKQRKGKA